MNMQKRKPEEKKMNCVRRKNGMKKKAGTIRPEKQQKRMQETALGGMRVLAL